MPAMPARPANTVQAVAARVLAHAPRAIRATSSLCVVRGTRCALLVHRAPLVMTASRAQMPSTVLRAPPGSTRLTQVLSSVCIVQLANPVRIDLAVVIVVQERAQRAMRVSTSLRVARRFQAFGTLLVRTVLKAHTLGRQGKQVVFHVM